MRRATCCNGKKARSSLHATQTRAARTSSAGSLGVVSLRERMEFIGGETQFDSGPYDGTTGALIAPLEDATAKAAQ